MRKDVNDLCLSDGTVHIGGTDFLSSLKDFFTFIDNNGKLKIAELEGKNIADIGAGFSDNMSFLRGILGKESKILCIDGIYKDELIDGGLAKVIDKITSQINHYIDEMKSITNFDVFPKDLKKDFNMAMDYSNRELDFAKKWKEKNKPFTYKTELEKEDNIDIAFCKNLFYKIEEPIRFITEILDKLTEDGELIIIDYPNLGMINIDFLLELSKVNIIDGATSINGKNKYVIFKINKKKFLNNIDEVNTKFIKLIGDKHKENILEELFKGIFNDILPLIEKEIGITDFIISKEDFEIGNFPDGVSTEMIEEIKNFGFTANSNFLKFYLGINGELFCEQEDDKEDF